MKGEGEMAITDNGGYVAGNGGLLWPADGTRRRIY